MLCRFNSMRYDSIKCKIGLGWYGDWYDWNIIAKPGKKPNVTCMERKKLLLDAASNYDKILYAY